MIQRITLIAVFAVFTTGAAAQTIFKSVMPDGRIVYGSAPAKGAATIESIQPTLPPPGESRPVAPSPAVETKTEQPANTLDAKWNAVEKELREAQSALARAKANAEAGAAPIAGEMVGNADNAFVRPRPEYIERQRELADKVKEAQNRLDEAFAARNALR